MSQPLQHKESKSDEERQARGWRHGQELTSQTLESEAGDSREQTPALQTLSPRVGDLAGDHLNWPVGRSSPEHEAGPAPGLETPPEGVLRQGGVPQRPTEAPARPRHLEGDALSQEDERKRSCLC